MFPSIFMTATGTTWYNSGAAVILGAMGPLSLGVSSVPIFAILCTVLYPAIGPWAGSIAAYAITTLGFCVPLAFLLRWRRDRNEVIAVANHESEAPCGEEGIEMDEVTQGGAEDGESDAKSPLRAENDGHVKLDDESICIEESVITNEKGTF